MPLDIGADMGVAKLKFRCQGDSQEMISTIGFARTGTASASQVATEIATAWLLAFPTGGFANTYAFTGCDVAIGPPQSAEVGQDNRNVPGGPTFAPLPTNCACLITKMTSQAGKGGRGRMFLPAAFLSEGEVDANGFISGPALTQLQASADDFFAHAGGGTSESVLAWLLFHNTTSANPGGSLADPITSLSVQIQIATQRQRMRR